MFGLTSFGFEYAAIKQLLQDTIYNLNAFFAKIVELLSKDEWITDITSSSAVISIIDAIKGVALTLCALFFLMDFFTKTMNLQWIKWENILMFCIKMVFAKVLIDKAPDICAMIYGGFNSVINTALDVGNNSSMQIIPIDKYIQYLTQSQQNEKWKSAFIAFGLTTEEAEKLITPPSIAMFDLTPMILSVKISVMTWLYTIILCICFVIVIGRLFELTVYTVIAPIPLATFASDGLHDIGKSFLKSYAAVSVQALVMVIMVIAYGSISAKIVPTLTGGIYGFAGIINVLALALGIMQSGSWAKRICGAM